MPECDFGYYESCDCRKNGFPFWRVSGNVGFLQLQSRRMCQRVAKTVTEAHRAGRFISLLPAHERRLAAFAMTFAAGGGPQNESRPADLPAIPVFRYFGISAKSHIRPRAVMVGWEVLSGIVATSVAMKSLDFQRLRQCTALNSQSDRFT